MAIYWYGDFFLKSFKKTLQIKNHDVHLISK